MISKKRGECWGWHPQGTAVRHLTAAKRYAALFEALPQQEFRGMVMDVTTARRDMIIPRLYSHAPVGQPMHT